MSEHRPSWLTAALIGAGSFLAGVLLVAALGGAKSSTTTTTARVTVTAPAPAAPAPTATAPAPGADGALRVPGVEGQPLDVAREALEGVGLEVDVQGGGLFGVVDESNWRVVSQSPAKDAGARAGDTVTVDICRRDGC